MEIHFSIFMNQGQKHLQFNVGQHGKLVDEKEDTENMKK